MEILQKKTQDEADHYTGIIAYGLAKNGKAYVLRIIPETNQTRFFLICRAVKKNFKDIFEKGDEMGKGILYDYYDEAVEGFECFLENTIK
jgi:hypothetical protein